MLSVPLPLARPGCLSAPLLSLLLQLLLASRPLLPLPVVSLDLSGHEVTNRVIMELVGCARALGPDCKVAQLRLSGCQLQLARQAGLSGAWCSSDDSVEATVRGGS